MPHRRLARRMSTSGACVEPARRHLDRRRGDPACVARMRVGGTLILGHRLPRRAHLHPGRRQQGTRRRQDQDDDTEPPASFAVALCEGPIPRHRPHLKRAAALRCPRAVAAARVADQLPDPLIAAMGANAPRLSRPRLCRLRIWPSSGSATDCRSSPSRVIRPLGGGRGGPDPIRAVNLIPRRRVLPRHHHHHPQGTGRLTTRPPHRAGDLEASLFARCYRMWKRSPRRLGSAAIGQCQIGAGVEDATRSPARRDTVVNGVTGRGHGLRGRPAGLWRHARGLRGGRGDPGLQARGQARHLLPSSPDCSAGNLPPDHG